MVMVFTLVSAAQEWLNVKWDEIKIHKTAEARRLREEEEEAERVNNIRVVQKYFRFIRRYH